MKEQERLQRMCQVIKDRVISETVAKAEVIPLQGATAGRGKRKAFETYCYDQNLEDISK
jgi:hypothetical protein